MAAVEQLRRRTRSLGENALRSQLTSAQQHITSLEGYIHNREREYQATVTHLHGERRESYGHNAPGIGGQFISQRRRRMGRTQGSMLSTMRSVESIDEEHEVDSEVLSAPLGEFVSLKIIKAVPKDETTPIPFVVRRLIGRDYHIGPNGVVIGTSPQCSIVLPAETEAKREHTQIVWNEVVPSTSRHLKSGGHFVLKDLTSSCTTDKLSLSNGLRFTTGTILWELTALPEDIAFTAKLFHLAKQRNLSHLKEEIDNIEPPNIPTLTITGSDDSDMPLSQTTPFQPLTSYDINKEYESPTYEGDEKFNALFSTNKSFGHTQLVPDTPISTNIRQTPRLLLHVAIDNGDEDMVRYLLSRGACVNKSAGELSYTAVHYAALRNNDVIMTSLLEYGADVEIRNVEHLPPLALTTSYAIRKLLLNSVLLCAAADDGDADEVARLFTTTPISPNVKGLRHKNALHLSSAKGFVEIVEILLLNGVDVNLKGGIRHRTALHYASTNGQAAVIQLLLSVGAQEFLRDADGYSALNLCQGDACRLLHSKPLSLCIAVQSGDVVQVTQLLNEQQVNMEDVINLRNDHNHAPLHLACITGSLELVQLLVSHGSHVDIHGGSDAWTPLFYAAIAGHIHLVEFLLSVGANPEERESDGNSVRERVTKVVVETEEFMARLRQRNRSESVVEASLVPRRSVNMLRQDSAPSCSVENQLEWQNMKLIKLRAVLSFLTTPSEKLLAALDDKNLTEFVSLLESGTVSSNVSLEDDSISILAQVCDDDLYGFAKALLDYGAKVCLDGTTSQIPLLVAAGNGSIPLLKLLMEYGADVNVQSTDTMSTALHESASANNIETVKYFLSMGANKGLVNLAGEVPFDCTTETEIRKLLATGDNRLLVAAMVDDTSAISHLVQKESVSVNTEFFRNGYTPLHQACEDGHTVSVSLLISLGADCNKKGGLFSQTPLHISSQLNHIEVTKILLQHAARVDIKDADGKVPFEVATTNQIRKVLVEGRQLRPSPVPLHESPKVESGHVCLICMDNPVNTIILPCGHQMFCTDCVTQITQCALDRQPIREVVPIFR